MKKFTAISIDDDEVFILVISKLLDQIPFIDLIATYTNPIEGILATVNKEPDFLFLDVEMPMIDGLETIQMLKNRPITIVITSHDETYEGIGKINPDAILTKPINLQKIESTLSRLIEERQLG